MQRFIKLSAVMAAIVAAPAFAAINVDGNAEFDTGVASGNGSDKSSFQGGRIELNFAGRAEGNGGFVAGRGTVIAGNQASSGAAGVDDAWVQIGTAAADVKLGRFEAADLYPTPGDVFRIGGAGLTTTNVLRGRTTYGTSGNDRVHLALTAALGAASLEVGLVDTKDVSTAGKGGSKGIRPSVAFAAGPVNARIGFESGKTADGANQVSFTGFGGGLSAAAGMATLRFNFGSNKTKFVTVAETKTTGFLVGADVGALNVSFESGKKTQGASETKTTGVFAAYAIPLFGIKGATFQPAFGTGSDKTGATKTTVTKVGARVHYDF